MNVFKRKDRGGCNTEPSNSRQGGKLEFTG